MSRVFDVEWDFHALNQSEKTISFGAIDEKYRHEIQSYLYGLIQWQKETSNSNSHAAVSSLIRTRVKLNTIATRWGKSDFSLLSSESGKSALKHYMGLAVKVRTEALPCVLIH